MFNFNRPETDMQRFVIVLHLKVDYFDLDRKKVDLFDRYNSEICKDLVAECSFVFCEPVVRESPPCSDLVFGLHSLASHKQAKWCHCLRNPLRVS